MKVYKNNNIVEGNGMIRKITKKEKEWFNLIRKTKKETVSGKRILDPFVGYKER